MLTHHDVSRDVVNHKPGCPVQRLRVRPGKGVDVYVATCGKCKAGALVDGTGAPLERRAIRPEATTPKPAVVAQFRCPEHGTPVTWRGTGCDPCQRDRITYRSRRTRRRAELIDTHPEGI